MLNKKEYQEINSAVTEMTSASKKSKFFTLELKNGQTFLAKALIHQKFDEMNKAIYGKPQLYFETLSKEKPKVKGASKEHQWKVGDTELYAWSIPASSVKNLKSYKVGKTYK